MYICVAAQDYIELHSEVYFPDLELETTKVDFGCILNDTDDMRLLTLANKSSLKVSYSWSFLARPPVRRTNLLLEGKGEEDVQNIKEMTCTKKASIASDCTKSPAGIQHLQQSASFTKEPEQLESISGSPHCLKADPTSPRSRDGDYPNEDEVKQHYYDCAKRTTPSEGGEHKCLKMPSQSESQTPPPIFSKSLPPWMRIVDNALEPIPIEQVCTRALSCLQQPTS